MSSNGMYSSLVKNNPEKYPSRMGKSWKAEEVNQLLAEVQAKKTHQEMATIHERTVGGITSRLRDIAADYYMNRNMQVEICQQLTGLSKMEILETVAKRTEIQERKAEKEEKTQKKSLPNSVSQQSQNTELKEILEIVRDMQKTLNDFIEGRYVRVKNPLQSKKVEMKPTP
jgi:hypothetical protein